MLRLLASVLVAVAFAFGYVANVEGCNNGGVPLQAPFAGYAGGGCNGGGVPLQAPIQLQAPFYQSGYGAMPLQAPLYPIVRGYNATGVRGLLPLGSRIVIRNGRQVIHHHH